MVGVGMVGTEIHTGRLWRDRGRPHRLGRGTEHPRVGTEGARETEAIGACEESERPIVATTCRESGKQRRGRSRVRRARGV